MAHRVKGLTLKGVDRVYRKALLEFEREWWAECLRRNGGCVSAAARDAGENRTAVYKILSSLGLAFTVMRHYGNWGDLTN